MQGPGIIYGTAWKEARTEEFVRTALRAGFRGIDTACQPKHYHEPGVGAAVAAWLGEGFDRGQLYLQTKFTAVSGQDPQRIPYDPRAPVAGQVAESFSASLRNLRTDYVDCLVLHSPMPTAGETLEAWRAMEALVDSGVVRQLGISNCYEPAVLRWLHAAVSIKPAVVQNRFYAATGYDREIRAFCRQHGIAYQGFWTLTANPQVLAHEEVTALASRHGRTPAQILFRYLTQVGVVPLTGTTSEAHMREDLAIFRFELTAGEREALGRLL